MGGYLIHFFADWNKLPEIVEVTTLDILILLRNYWKLNDDENGNLPARLKNIVNSDGSIFEDTEEDLESEEEGSAMTSMGDEESDK